VPNSTASTYIMLVRSLCLPPTPLKQTLEAPPPSLLHALAVLVTQTHELVFMIFGCSGQLR
jgi:hypothetical protein